MRARKITVRDFRNIKEATVEFADGINVIYGDNAEGKTNLLEALYFAAIGKSFRGQHVSELIRFGEREAYLLLDFHAAGRDQSISLGLSGARVRSALKNRVKCRRMSELVGSFRAVLFCPEHLSLIKDGPAERRQFLDIAISAAEPLYLSALQRYNRVLKQRNTLLKAAEKDMDLFLATVPVWSKQLAREGAYIARSRARYVKKAAAIVKSCFADMTGEREEPELLYLGVGGKDYNDYENLEKTEELLLKKLTENHIREIAAGTTLWGIHKDDIEVLLNGRSARSFCSQGQQRSLALSLKIAEGELCKQDSGEYPVFLFDDVLSELDRSRREYLLHHALGKQVIMTTCEKEGLEADHLILVKNGTYERIEAEDVFTRGKQ